MDLKEPGFTCHALDVEKSWPRRLDAIQKEQG